MVLRCLLRFTGALLRLAGMASVVISILVFCGVFLVWARFPGNAVFPADCGLVFGAGVWPVYNSERRIVDAVAGPGIRRRVQAAADLYRTGQVGQLIMSGGTGEGMPRSEALVMRDYALSLGVPLSAIRIEDQSHSTWQNLQNTQGLTTGCRRLVGISDRYHLARIEVLSALSGRRIMVHPASPSIRTFELYSAVRESLLLIGLILFPY